MYESTATNTTVTSTALPANRHRSLAMGLVGAVVIAGLTFVGANIYIPLVPVPITLQTLFVLLAGAAISGRYGAVGQGLYVCLGAFGLPVFAGGLSGLGVLGGPTGGYLLSFLVVPFVVGAMLRRSRSVTWLLFTFSTGTAVIFACGVTHLAVVYTGDVAQAIRVGMLPFLPGAALKIVAATSISRSYWALTDRRRSSGAS